MTNTTPFAGITKIELFQQAKDLGALTFNIHLLKIERPAMSPVYEQFSYHFFNVDGLEVAYFVPDLVEFTGLTDLSASPRKWSQSALNDHTPLRSITEGLLGSDDYLDLVKRNKS